MTDDEGTRVTQWQAAPPSQSEPVTLSPGTVLDGRFEIVRKLGEGGMGEVYEARQPSLDRSVAIKVLHAKFAARPDARARFEREARVASRLRHPNAVEVYDVGEHEGLVFMAMEFLEGGNLWDQIGGGELLPLGVSLGIAAQVADVLVAAHAESIVHRDLKPENVFLEATAEGWRVVVVDFGLAFIQGDQTLGRVTREGLVVGTPQYVSPEQAQGMPVGAPSDVYSLGCVLFELLTGSTPFGGSEVHILTQHLYVTPAAPSRRVPEQGIPRELDDLVLAMLAKSEDQRPTAATVRERLRLLEGTLEGVRNRGKDATYLRDRSARMVSVPADARARVRPPRLAPASEDALVVGVHGPLSEEMWIGLRTNDMSPIAVAPGNVPGGVGVILENTGAIPVVEMLAKHGRPLVVACPAGDMDKLTELVRVGASEVVGQPIRVDRVVRKVRRAFEKAARDKKGDT